MMGCGDTDAKANYPSEHSWIDGDVPAARVAALQRRRPSRNKSTGHEQGDQVAVLLRPIFYANSKPPNAVAQRAPVVRLDFRGDTVTKIVQNRAKMRARLQQWRWSQEWGIRTR